MLNDYGKFAKLRYPCESKVDIFCYVITSKFFTWAKDVIKIRSKTVPKISNALRHVFADWLI